MKQDVADHNSLKKTPPLIELGPDFFTAVQPATFAKQILRYKNESLNLQASIANFTWDHLWHFKPLDNFFSQPLAMKYHGHQFRHYNPELGDGRGFTYYQFLKDHQWYDLGTKGSGQTPYSRNGDGRLTLKGAFREALATELLESYGVNTSKTVCIYETGESLVRYDEPSPTRAAVLTRLSLGHIRIGTFERFAYLNDIQNLKKLTVSCLKTYYSSEVNKINLTSDDEVSMSFMQLVTTRLAKLCAQVMVAGFVHGVLNSDNINVSGELFDYGPYRFLPEYDPFFIAAYFDQQGLYAFGEQPNSFLWNLLQLGLSLKKAYPELNLEVFIEGFKIQFNDYLYDFFQRKINTRFSNDEETTQFISLCFELLSEKKQLFEEFFFDIHSARAHSTQQKLLSIYNNNQNIQNLLELLKSGTLYFENINQHEYFKREKPCTLIIDELEKIWLSIAENDDWQGFEEKLTEIRSFRGIYNYH